jgi:hypothetical protein
MDIPGKSRMNQMLQDHHEDNTQQLAKHNIHFYERDHFGDLDESVDCSRVLRICKRCNDPCLVKPENIPLVLMDCYLHQRNLQKIGEVLPQRSLMHLILYG